MGLDNDLVLLDLNVLDMDISANCPWSRTTSVPKIGIGIELQFLAAIKTLAASAACLCNPQVTGPPKACVYVLAKVPYEEKQK